MDDCLPPCEAAVDDFGAILAFLFSFQLPLSPILSSYLPRYHFLAALGYAASWVDRRTGDGTSYGRRGAILLGLRAAPSCSCTHGVWKHKSLLPWRWRIFLFVMGGCDGISSYGFMCTHSSTSLYFLGAFRFWRLLKTVMVGCMNGRLFAPHARRQLMILVRYLAFSFRFHQGRDSS